jgi:protein-S-isoprenylcysteine O-methyltransferase Ste14
MKLGVFVVVICFVAWAVVHSSLAGHTVKGWVSRFLGHRAMRWYRLSFNVFALMTFLPLVGGVFLYPDELVYMIPSPWRWFMQSGQLVLFISIIRVVQKTGILHFLGLEQLKPGDPQAEPVLLANGLYRYVRHPLYTLSIVLLWLTPTMYWNRLTLYMLMSLYFFVGSLHEERLLIAEFGKDYLDYRRQVPRLFPWPFKRYRR